jgi:MFS family permease
LFASITGLATLGGPLIGGAIVQTLTWQWIFWVNVSIAAVPIPLVLVRLEENAGSLHGLDYVGIGLVSAAAFGLVWGLIRGNESGWASPEVVAALTDRPAAWSGGHRIAAGTVDRGTLRGRAGRG